MSRLRRLLVSGRPKQNGAFYDTSTKFKFFTCDNTKAINTGTKRIQQSYKVNKPTRFYELKVIIMFVNIRMN